MNLACLIASLTTAGLCFVAYACTNRLPTLREMRSFRHHVKNSGHTATHDSTSPTQRITCDCGRQIELRRPVR